MLFLPEIEKEREYEMKRQELYYEYAETEDALRTSLTYTLECLKMERQYLVNLHWIEYYGD